MLRTFTPGYRLSPLQGGGTRFWELEIKGRMRSGFELLKMAWFYVEGGEKTSPPRPRNWGEGSG